MAVRPYNDGVLFTTLFAEAMAERGLSLKETAELLGVSGNVPGRWRKGPMLPSDRQVPLLAQHLGHTEAEWAQAIYAEKRLAETDADELRRQIRRLRRELREAGVDTT